MVYEGEAQLLVSMAWPAIRIENDGSSHRTIVARDQEGQMYEQVAYGSGMVASTIAGGSLTYSTIEQLERLTGRRQKEGLNGISGRKLEVAIDPLTGQGVRMGEALRMSNTHQVTRVRPGTEIGVWRPIDPRSPRYSIKYDQARRLD